MSRDVQVELLVASRDRGISHQLMAKDSPDVLFLLEAGSLNILEIGREDTAYGYPREGLLGRSFTEIAPGVTPELLERARIGRHDPHPDVPLRVSLIRADGERFPVDLRVRRRDDDDEQSPLVCAIRQHSERARIAERELIGVIAAVPAAIATWRPDGEIISWNPAAERLFGIRARAAIGRNIRNLVPKTDREAFALDCARVLSGDTLPSRGALRLSQDDHGHDELEVEETLFLIRDVAEQPIRLGAVFRDRSDVAVLRRRAEALRGPEQSSLPAAPQSKVMRDIMGAAEQAAADPRATVLLLGETGVGKSHLARWIHTHSPRSDKPILAINCAGLDSQLAESELFGHERGAFTGAVSQKRGIVEAADGGTLLLDEVAELPLPVQAKLLTFLDDGGFRRLGGVKRLQADVRILAATNVDLEEAVAAGTFRKDLYYRLRVLPLRIPPLRERREEIGELARGMLEDLCRRRRQPPVTLTGQAARALVGYDWPGNFRELRNALERGLILSRGQTLDAEHLPLELEAALKADASGSEKLDDVIRSHIERVLAEEEGNRTRAATRLGIDRATLRRRIAR